MQIIIIIIFKVNSSNGVCDRHWNLCQFIKNALDVLSVLEILDFGIEKRRHIHDWPLKLMKSNLTYLRITVLTPFVLFNLMNTEPLCHTLKQLHITLSDAASVSNPRYSDGNVWPRMEALHTFTFIKSFRWHFNNEWFLLDKLTGSDVMPLLRRMNFCIVIDIDDLDRMYRSALFTDYRHVNIHYAFMINDNREHVQLIDSVQRYNQYHQHQIVSATFNSESWPNIHLLFETYDDVDHVSFHFLNIKSKRDLFFLGRKVQNLSTYILYFAMDF